MRSVSVSLAALLFSTCSAEASDGVRVDVSSFECTEDLFNKGYDKCKLFLSVSITDPETSNVDLPLRCIATATTFAPGDIFPDRIETTGNGSIYVTSGTGQAYVEMVFRVARLFNKPVLEVRLDSAECQVSN